MKIHFFIEDTHLPKNFSKCISSHLITRTANEKPREKEFSKCDDFSGEIRSAHQYQFSERLQSICDLLATWSPGAYSPGAYSPGTFSQGTFSPRTIFNEYLRSDIRGDWLLRVTLRWTVILKMAAIRKRFWNRFFARSHVFMHFPLVWDYN
jgi:hypothetical protein